MKIVYCANCGQRLNISRRALPQYATVIDVVEYHECSTEMQELDLSEVDIPQFKEREGKNKFVQNLNSLVTKSIESKGDLRKINVVDRREEVKSTAPRSIHDLINTMDPSEPGRYGGME